MTPDVLARIMARHQLERRDIVLIVVFARSHPGQTFTRALWDYLHAVGPAAVAAGRAVPGGIRLAPAQPPARVLFWQHDVETRGAA